MNNNPFLNALAAAVYIVIVVFITNTLFSPPQEEETILIPMFMLSLFVLSAAIMGFLFFYQPFRLYFENQKREAFLFFMRTVGFFAGFVALFFVSLLYLLPG